MRIVIAALIALLAPVPAPAMQCRGPAAENSVKRMLVSEVAAWNRGNLERFMQGYWRSPHLTFFAEGKVRKGWEQTFLRYRQHYQGEGRNMGQLEFQGLNIDLVSCRAAVVTGEWQLTMSDGHQPHGLFTLVVKHKKGGWRIVHDHTSEARKQLE
jgi:beta-aspartyl-peptidase (threonine type)